MEVEYIKIMKIATKLPSRSWGEMKRFATQEDEAVAHIPPVARLVPVRVELALAGIPVHVEEVWVAVRIV